MKKKGIILAAAALAAAAGVTGCVHHCPPPEESLDCYPICREVKSGNQRNVKAEWEAFKLTPDYPFIPTRRYRKIDEIGKLVADLVLHLMLDCWNVRAYCYVTGERVTVCGPSG